MAKDPLLQQPPSPFTKEDGWGADLDPKNRPAVPKEKPSDVKKVRGNVIPPRMTPNVKIHLSVEHPDLTPVFGTTCPPRGLSGMLRDHAYKYGEGRLARWLTLMLADRVDVVEGRIEDLTRGQMPHPIHERGLDAPAARDERNTLVRNLSMAGAGVALLAVGVAMSRRTRENKRRLVRANRKWKR